MFQFDPTTGLLDLDSFPSDPASETIARQQFMTLFNQIKTYLNVDMKVDGTLATNGEIKIPIPGLGTFIAKWGRATFDNPGNGATYSKDIVFSSQFPTEAFVPFTNVIGAAGADPITFNPQFYSVSTTGATLRVWNQSGSNPSTLVVSWIVIGH